MKKINFPRIIIHGFGIRLEDTYRNLNIFYFSVWHKKKNLCSFGLFDITYWWDMWSKGQPFHKKLQIQILFKKVVLWKKVVTYEEYQRARGINPEEKTALFSTLIQNMLGGVTLL